MFKKAKWLLVMAVLACMVFPHTVPVLAADYASIVSLSASNTKLVPGETLTLTIRTNNVTNYVIVDCDNARYYAAYQTTDSMGVKEWRVNVTPKKTQSLLVYANTQDSLTGSSSRSVPINVNVNNTGANTNNTGTSTNNVSTGTGGVKINSVNASKTAIVSGETVTFTVETSAKVNTVWTEHTNNSNKVYTMAKQQSTNSDGSKVWTVSLKLSAEQTVVVKANTSYVVAGAASAEQKITIEQSPAQITSARVNSSSIYYGDSVTFTIRTNVETEYVWVDYDNKTAYAKVTSTTKGAKAWSVTVTPSKTQTIAIFANKTDSASGADTKTQSVTVSDYSQYVSINSATYSWQYDYLNPIYANNNALTVTVETSSAATYVWLNDGYTTRDLTLTSTRSGYKTWQVTYTPSWYYNNTTGYTGTNTVNIYAGTSRNSTETSYKLTVNWTYNNSGIGYIDSFIYSGNNFQVLTSSAVSYVELYGPTGYITTLYSPVNYNNSLYYWAYYAITPASGTYTIRAYNSSYGLVDTRSTIVN